MRSKISLFVLGALILGWSGIAVAGRPPGTPDQYDLKKVGSATVNEGTIARGGHEIALFVVTAGSSAGTVTFADPASDPSQDGDYGAATVIVVELGAAANTTVQLDLTESPIRFSNGIEINSTDSSMVGQVYEFRS